MSAEQPASEDRTHSEPTRPDVSAPTNTRRRLPDRATTLVRINVLLAILIATIIGKMPSVTLVLFLVMIPAGAFLWKIPPFDIGLRPGRRTGFFRHTIDRGQEAVRTTGRWGGEGGVFGGFAGFVVGAINRDHLLDTAAIGAIWGGLVCGLTGACIWTFRRTMADVHTLQESRTKHSP